jgi:hypothetical protein
VLLVAFLSAGVEVGDDDDKEEGEQGATTWQCGVG